MSGIDWVVMVSSDDQVVRGSGGNEVVMVNCSNFWL